MAGQPASAVQKSHLVTNKPEERSLMSTDMA